MKESKVYTQQEIDSNINILSNQLDDLKLKKRQLNFLQDRDNFKLL